MIMNTKLLKILICAGGILVTGWTIGSEPIPPKEPPELTRDYRYWRGAYEKTPGPFLCRQPDVTGVTVVCDRWPDTTDIRQFGLDAIRLSGAKTMHEKALALWQWHRRVKTQTNGQAPTDPFHPERDGAQVNDPVKIMNVYGAHWCSGLARVVALKWRALGYEGHALHRASHGMSALYYKDVDEVGRYHLFDVNFGGYTLDRTGQRVMTPDEFSTDLYQWMHIWYFGEPWPMPTHRVDLALRRGESLKRIWGNWGKPFHDNIGPKGDQRTRKPSEKGPYPITFGNGMWTYSPALSSAGWEKGLAEPPVNMAKSKLVPAAAGKWAGAVWHFRTPYIVVETEVELMAFRKSKADMIKFSLSVDNGRTWKECWKAPSNETGKKTFTVKLNQKFTVKPRDFKIPKDFNSPFGRYAYRLKLDLFAKDSAEDCRVENITFKTTVQHAIRALPQLWPGKNTINVGGKVEKGAALRVTYVWDDPKGKERKNVTVAEELPYTYEIIAAGSKWEDCVCRELTVEAVTATEEGNRTVVKEEPSEIQKLPPLPPAIKTRTRWGRPGTGRRKKLAIDECIDRIENNKRGLSKALVWIAELQDPKGFEAAMKVAFDSEICKRKGIKELAMLAMYNSDRKRARTELLKIAKDSEFKTGWKYSAKDPSVAGGHWMSGVCIIGQMAAKSGWKEYIPAMAKALDSEYCGGRSEMSIMRSFTKLAEPGDPVATKAVRKCLARTFAYMLPEAALAAGKVQDRESIPRLRELLDHPFMAVRRRAAVALGMLGDTESAPKLRESLFRIRKREILDHTKYNTEFWMDEFMRAASAEGLGLMKDKGSLSALEKALANEPVPWVRKKIEAAVAMIKNS